MCKNEDKKMQPQYYLQFGVSLLALIGGFLSYILSLKVKHDILENNEKLEKEIATNKDIATAAISSLRSEFVHELSNNLRRQDDKLDAQSSDLNAVTATLTDKILATTNGKYRRTEVCEANQRAVAERFDMLKELIETVMGRIESGLTKQIADLKDRLK
jgi:signal transduction histidine kinase